jgi:hypothetical protein
LYTDSLKTMHWEGFRRGSLSFIAKADFGGDGHFTVSPVGPLGPGSPGSPRRPGIPVLQDMQTE